jgi:transcriptional regulator GlxA family with amidase domain
MLRETRLPIAEIALAVGFSDQSALTRCLRRRRATTPLALRRGGFPLPLGRGSR